jgi:hypothetical protein
VCGLADLGYEKWSNVSDSVGPSSFSSWDGQMNTGKIIAQSGHTGSAAKVCDTYSNPDYGTGIYSDWYLPSIKQLCLLNNAVFQVNKAIETDGNKATVPITFQPCWSSNEYRNPGNLNYAYGYYFEFEKGTIGWTGKYNTLFVRPIRSF